MGIELVRLTRDEGVGRMPVTGNRQPYGLLHGGASAVLATSRPPRRRGDRRSVDESGHGRRLPLPRR
jgi:hypothetical protein